MFHVAQKSCQVNDLPMGLPGLVHNPFLLVTQCPPPVGFSRRLLLRALPLASAVKKKGRDSQSIMLTQKFHPGSFLSYVDYKSISVCSQRSWTFVIFTSFLVLNIDIILHLYIFFVIIYLSYFSSSALMCRRPIEHILDSSLPASEAMKPRQFSTQLLSHLLISVLRPVGVFPNRDSCWKTPE